MRYLALLSLIVSFSASAFSQNAASVSIKDAFSVTDRQMKPFLDEALKNMDKFEIPAPVSPYGEISKNSTETADPYLYLPIYTKAVYEYEYTSSDFVGPKKVIVEFKGYSEKDSLTSASITYYNKSGVKTSDFSIKLTQNGLNVSDTVLEGPRLEIPVPLFKGKEWTENSNKNRVSTFSAKASVPAGNYDNCLRVTTKIGGGDAGSSERFYAPNIGLVLENITAEDKQETLKLVSFSKK